MNVPQRLKIKKIYIHTYIYIYILGTFLVLLTKNEIVIMYLIICLVDEFVGIAAAVYVCFGDFIFDNS